MFIICIKNNVTALNHLFLNRYVIGLSKEVLLVNFGQGVSKLKARKVLDKKKVETFWVRGYILYSGARENTRENTKVQN